MPAITAGELRQSREESTLSQAELASLIGVSKGLVDHWESGRKPIPPARAIELRQVFAVQAPIPIPDLSGGELRAIREAAGVTQTALARMQGVKQQAIAAWEREGVPGERREVLVSAAAHPGGFVGGLVRAEREQIGMTQTELASALGVTQTRVSDWERGSSQIPLEQWPRIREAVDTRTPRRSQQPVRARELREGRRRLGWSQQRLADELGVTKAVVGNWEAGARKPVPRERCSRIRELLRLSEPEQGTVRDRVAEALVAVREHLAATPGLSRSELSRAVHEAPEPYVRVAVLRALAADLIHERRVKRTRADGVARQMPCLYLGSASTQPPPPDPDAELLAEVVAAVRAEPGRSRRSIAESLRHDRGRGERAVDRGVAEGLLHTREVVKRGPRGPRTVLGVFADPAPGRISAPIDGEKVRRLRTQMLIGQAELAERLGVSPSMLRGWERSDVPAAWAKQVEESLFPGEGSREARVAEAKQRVRDARATIAERILMAVREQPGIPRRECLAFCARWSDASFTRRSSSCLPLASCTSASAITATARACSGARRQWRTAPVRRSTLPGFAPSSRAQA